MTRWVTNSDRASRRNGHVRLLVEICIASLIPKSGAAFEGAIRRGAKIDVFADPLLNQGPAAGGLSQMEAVEKVFAKIGVRLHKLPHLQSKIVAIDSDVLCVGSYNWLSADRHGLYARHETSFVYRVQHLEEEIRAIFDSLKRRESRVASF